MQVVIVPIRNSYYYYNFVYDHDDVLMTWLAAWLAVKRKAGQVRGTPDE